MAEELIPGDAVQAIQDGVKTEVLTVEDRQFVTRQVYLLPDEPSPKMLTIHTLSGLVDYIKEDPDGLKGVIAAIHVVSPERVEVIGSLDGHQRWLYAAAIFEKVIDGSPFYFGRFCDAETFNIALQSLFTPAGDWSKVLALVGNVKDEAVRGAEDDGMTQAVIAKRGIKLSQEVKVPNPVTLAPFRTFAEIEQPASQFVLRVRGGGEGKTPEAALFESDGGKWKLEAIKSIKQYLTEALPDVTIIA